ncbi:hypothetical protein EWM64_g748 [Hericium alpestre]|uniref:Uncharacterized protein n=1 Tax=Hericium alpestre TaxID=135208 RepID=A0A4Z0ABA1_9AGAM|nr:hypothetical protein EWM64_g748 [Hericium alpestre]
MPFDLRVLSIRAEYSGACGSLAERWSAAHWPIIFKDCIGVEHIIVSQSVAPSLLDALLDYITPHPSHSSRLQEVFDFSTLKTISIDFIDPDEDNTLEPLFPGQLAESLCQAQNAGRMGPVELYVSEWEDLDEWEAHFDCVHSLPQQTYFREGNFWDQYDATDG